MVSFEDFTITQLKKIIEVYNLHVKIKVANKTKKELIDEMKKHLKIENEFIKLIEDSYLIDPEDFKEKKEKKTKAKKEVTKTEKKEEPKKEEPKKEEPKKEVKKEEPKKQEPKKEKPKKEEKKSR